MESLQSLCFQLWCYSYRKVSQTVSLLPNCIASDFSSVFHYQKTPLVKCLSFILHTSSLLEERRCHRVHQCLINAPFTLFMKTYSPRCDGCEMFKCNEWSLHSSFLYRRLLMSVWPFDVIHPHQAKLWVTTPNCSRPWRALKVWTSASMEGHTCKLFMAQKEW